MSAGLLFIEAFTLFDLVGDEVLSDFAKGSGQHVDHSHGIVCCRPFPPPFVQYFKDEPICVRVITLQLLNCG